MIKDVVRTRRLVAQNHPARFFEVELSGILRHGNDRLINVEQVSDYLSQSGASPFAPDFCFAKDIEELLRLLYDLMRNVLIHVNESDKPIFRPHLNTFEARKGITDTFSEMKPIEIKDGDQAHCNWLDFTSRLSWFDR